MTVSTLTQVKGSKDGDGHLEFTVPRPTMGSVGTNRCPPLVTVVPTSVRVNANLEPRRYLIDHSQPVLENPRRVQTEI